MSEQTTVKTRYEVEAEKEATKARARALNRAKERDAVSEGFKAHTKGEKLFNDITYTGFGYFGVTAFSVFMTWLIRDTKPFKTYFDKGVEGLSKVPGFKNSAKSILNIGALFLGGSLMTVTGIKALEDNKAKIVKHFDKQIYGEETIKNDPEIVEAHRIMDTQPKQTWASVGWSRVVAFGATISTWLLIGQNKAPVSKLLNTSIDTMGTQFGRWGSRTLKPSLAEDVSKAIHLDKTDVFKDIHGGSNMRDLNKHDKSLLTKIMTYTGTDAIYTVITSIGLFVSTRVLAPVFDKAGLENLTKGRDHKSEPEAHVKPIPADSLERAPDPTVPRVKVENVQAIDRLSQQAAAQHAGVAQ